MYGTFLKLDNTKDAFVESKEILKIVLGKEFLSELEKKPQGLYLDLNLQASMRQCQEINDLLMKKTFSQGLPSEKTSLDILSK